MKRKSFLFVLTGLALGAIFATATTTPAQESPDKQILDLAGKWEITYTNDAVRIYAIDAKGMVSFDEANLKGRIVRKSEALILVFGGDPKTERLTMGVDGRLFVEHFHQQEDLVGKRPVVIGIGIRQK